MHTEKERVHGSTISFVAELANELQARVERVKSSETLDRRVRHLVPENKPLGRPPAPNWRQKQEREVYRSNTRLT